MRNAERLRVLTEAEDLAVEVYRLTARFPHEERHGLTAQTRRAAVSIGSNIIEGSQRQGDRAFLPFLHNALGSAAELEFQLRVAARLGFSTVESCSALAARTNTIRRMIARLITVLRSRI